MIDEGPGLLNDRHADFQNAKCSILFLLINQLPGCPCMIYIMMHHDALLIHAKFTQGLLSIFIICGQSNRQL